MEIPHFYLKIPLKTHTRTQGNKAENVRWNNNGFKIN